MQADAKKPTSEPPRVPPATAFLLFATIGDTTWRLFVPSVGGTILGLLADRAWNTKPWLTITGITIGSILAILLVRLQLKKINGGSKK